MIAEAWDEMLANAERAVEPGAERGRGRRGRGGGNELLCLAYRMTGDKRFGEKAKASLFRHQFGGRKSSMLMKRNPPWRAGLDAGDKCHSFAIAYDTVYDLLTPKERKELASRCAEEGILPVLNDWVLGDERIHTLDTMGHNWWSAIVFGAGIELSDLRFYRYDDRLQIALADATGSVSIANFFLGLDSQLEQQGQQPFASDCGGGGAPQGR